jgi:hypothetical protein
MQGTGCLLYSLALREEYSLCTHGHILCGSTARHLSARNIQLSSQGTLLIDAAGMTIAQRQTEERRCRQCDSGNYFVFSRHYLAIGVTGLLCETWLVTTALSSLQGRLTRKCESYDDNELSTGPWPWGAINQSGRQEIPRASWNPKYHCLYWDRWIYSTPKFFIFALIIMLRTKPKQSERSLPLGLPD